MYSSLFSTDAAIGGRSEDKISNMVCRKWRLSQRNGRSVTFKSCFSKFYINPTIARKERLAAVEAKKEGNKGKVFIESIII